MENSHILVLGVGNALMSDEGVGVQCIHQLEQSYSFSGNVQLLDGGTLGMRLLDSIRHASCLIVVDAALRGSIPGTITRLVLDDIKTENAPKHSMHSVSFSETLAIAASLDILPPTVIIGIEPLDITTMSVSLTSEIAKKLDALCLRVLDEIKIAGGSFKFKNKKCHPWPECFERGN
jgi:hydrogenase maturation protease